ncbi:hypothetical protein JG687_00012819, partial [Phytophthora cactorum]
MHVWRKSKRILRRRRSKDRRQSLFTGAFRELGTINGESIAVWPSRVPLQSPICLDALSTQDCMRYLTSMEQRGITGRSTFALLTQDEVTREHSSTDAAGLVFEQIQSRLPFSSTSTKGR